MAKPTMWILLLSIIEYIYDRFIRQIWGLEDLDDETIDGKVVVITGANTGLGKVTATKLARRGAAVIMGCRNLEMGRLALQDIKLKTGSESLFLKHLDLADLASVKTFANEVRDEFPEIHILINNAGVYYNNDTLIKTKDGFEIHMGINHLGHFLLTNILLENIKRAAPSRIVTVSSTNQLIGDLNLDDLMLEKVDSLGFQNSLPYNNSKLANSLFSKELGRRLQGTGVTSYSLCPGLVATEVFRNFSPVTKFYTKINLTLVGLTPEQGCETILYCALSRKCAEENGNVYRFCKKFQSANKNLSKLDNLAFTLWQISEKLVQKYII